MYINAAYVIKMTFIYKFEWWGLLIFPLHTQELWLLLGSEVLPHVLLRDAKATGQTEDDSRI